MIDKAELIAKSDEFQIHIANVQRDYVFGWLLFAIFNNEHLSRLLILKGGNCFRKGYFPNTRFSADLDFSTVNALDLSRFEDEIEQCCKHAQESSGVQFVTEKNSFSLAPTAILGKGDERRIYKGKVYFVDFSGTKNAVEISVRMDVTEFDRLYLPVAEVPLIHPYSDGDKCSVTMKCVAVEEAIANKLKCLLQRRHSFDLYDLVHAAFFNEHITLDRSQIMSVFFKKTIFERSPGSAKQILLGLPMAFFRTAWNKYVVCPAQSMMDFDKAEAVYSSFIEELFSPFGTFDRMSNAFFPAQLRNKILEAGSAKKLLRISYQGYERLMEPYALVYKRRVSDNVGQEYLYVWDRSGGRSGTVGIKTLLNPDIRSLDIVEEFFEPRYEIELSKAGEQTGRGYFGKGSVVRHNTVKNAAKKSSRVPRNSYLGSQKRVVQCTICQKKFTRNSTSNVLKPHKNQWGGHCFGTVGILVGWTI